MVDLTVDIGKLILKNPVMTASGTFGYGKEYEEFVDISKLGGIVVKGITGKERQGHPYPRMAETPSGILNAVGLQNKGIDYFENSKRATLSNREFCIQNPNGWVGYDSLTWGISACDGPGDFKKDGKKFYGYAGRGATGPKDFLFDDGTLTPTAAGGSVPFVPEICIATLKNMYDKYGSKGLWGK